MKRYGIMIAILSIAIVIPAQKMKQMDAQGGEYLQYEIESFDSQAWIVTAHEIPSGKRFRFRLPPDIFKGQTFSLESKVLNPGRPFVVRGPKNARLNNVVMEKIRPMERIDATRGKKHPVHPAPPGISGMQPARLEWVIMNVDPVNFVVTAQNEKTRKTIRFKVNPQCFTGLRFFADTGNLASGMAFSIIVPNEKAFEGCCTLME